MEEDGGTVPYDWRVGPGYGSAPFAQPRGWTGYAPAYVGHHHGGHPLAWVLFALLLVLLLLVIANLAATLQRKRRGAWGRSQGPWQHRWAGPAFAGGAPEEVLRLRYARGEISRDEFLQASADLAGPGAPPPADG
jgi:uncharacterized membrane protein